LHAADAAVIEHHSTFYRALIPDSIGVSLEFGAGPNLYPLMLAAAVSRSIHAVDQSASNVAYLTRQLHDGTDESWQPFYAECRRLQPALPDSLATALARVDVSRGNVLRVPPGTYELASMHFVAESVTEDFDQFSLFCQVFIQSVRAGGLLIATFMENLGRYYLGNGSRWPGYPVDTERVRQVFGPHTDDLDVIRIDADPSLPDYGYTGMLLLTARRRRGERVNYVPAAPLDG